MKKTKCAICMRRMIVGLMGITFMLLVFMLPTSVQAASGIMVTNLTSDTVIKPNTYYQVKYKSDKSGGQIKFKSSNKRIATISSKGVIHAKKPGRVKITVYQSDKNKKSVTIRIGKRVSKIKISGIKFFTPGKTSKLTAKVTPATAANKGLVWTSSDPAVATVDQKGRVKGIREGITTITAKAKDGSGKKQTAKVVIFKFSRNDTKWAGHRGLRGEALENSTASFSLTGQYGLWGAECDIWETKHDTDGSFEIVINHDSTFERVHGVSRDVREMTADEIRADSRLDTICFFDEYLSICAEYGMIPLVEIKDPDISDEALARAMDMITETVPCEKPEDVYLLSFYPERMAAAKEYFRQSTGFEPITLYEISKGRKKDVENQSALKYVVNNGFAGISLHKSLLSDAVDEYCKMYGLKICLWTYWDDIADNALAYQQLLKSDYQIDSVIIEEMMFD